MSHHFLNLLSFTTSLQKKRKWEIFKIWQPLKLKISLCDEESEREGEIWRNSWLLGSEARSSSKVQAQETRIV